MWREKSRTAQFFIAFFMGLFILALPFSYALFKFEISKRLEEPQPERFYPQVSDSIVITAAIKNKETEDPMSFVLCRIDPYQNAIKFAVLPPETLVEDAGGFYMASKVWGDEGARRGAQALQSAAGIENGRYIELDSEAIVKLGETIGAIDITLDEEISLENGLMTLSKQRQLIDGTKAALLMNYRGYSGGETQRLGMIEKLFSQVLNQRCTLLNDALLQRIFETAVNSGYSDLTIGDFESRRRAINHMLDNDFDIDCVTVTGEYNTENDTFLLSSDSIEKIISEFSP